MMHNSSSATPRVFSRLAKCAKRNHLKCAVHAGFALLFASLPFAVSGQTFTAPSPIQIPSNSLTQGPSSLYPAPLTVSGVGATLTGLTVTFFNLSHAYPDDIDILLVGPSNQNVLLMSDAGGYFSISNLTLTFSDSAASFLPDETMLSSGTFRPTNYNAQFMVDSFAPPAPVEGPYGSTLSLFNGTNPNGVWNLYVLDDTQGNSGTMAGGWSLTVAAVPEPSTFALGASALVILGLFAAHRRRAATRV